MTALRVNFKAGSFPKMLAELTHSNQFLKIFSFGSLCLSLGLMMLLFLSVTREPIVIALTSKGDVLKRVEAPKPEDEVRAAVQAYIEKRYNWERDTIDRRLDQAKAFVSSQFVQNFVQGVSNVRKFSKEKSVSQRAYASNVSIDLKRSVAVISGDRITEIQGMRAAGAFNLELTFQGGPRSTENPWGVYISKEVEK